MTAPDWSPDIQSGHPNSSTTRAQLCAGDFGYGSVWVRAQLRGGGQLVFVGHDLNPQNLSHAEYEDAFPARAEWGGANSTALLPTAH